MKENKASTTAYTVVHGMLHVLKNPKFAHLADCETVDTCTKILSATEAGRKRLGELNDPIKSKVLPFLEWVLMPGATLNYVLRKKYIEEKVLEAIENGVTQVINIGAGFDTLAWRLSSLYLNLNFIEIDHPATSEEKIKALKNESKNSKNLHFVPADLSKVSLEYALGLCDAFDFTKKTLYICEGVLMYLDEEDVKDVFNSLRNLTGKGSLFIFSCLEPSDSDKNNIRKLLDFYLMFKDESFHWSIRDYKLSSFLRKHNYSLLDMADSEFYRQNYLSDDFNGTLHKGEYLVMAKVS